MPAWKVLLKDTTFRKDRCPVRIFGARGLFRAYHLDHKFESYPRPSLQPPPCPVGIRVVRVTDEFDGQKMRVKIENYSQELAVIGVKFQCVTRNNFDEILERQSFIWQGRLSRATSTNSGDYRLFDETATKHDIEVTDVKFANGRTWQSRDK